MLLKVQLLTPTNHVHNNHSPLSFFLNQWHTYQFACLSYDFNMTDHNQVVSFSNAICTVYSTDNVCRPNNNLKTQETEIQMLTNLKTLENSEKKLAELVFNNKKLLFVFFQFLMSPVNYTIVLFPHKF
jgi:DNA-directed RNA polymerase specialized sigma subunit